MSEYMKAITENPIKRAYQWRTKGGYHVLNIPCAFDIETSSFYEGDEKRAIMYIWQFAFNGYVFIGRTWVEFKELLQHIMLAFNIDMDNRLYIYIHNESYEFQFMRKWFEWDSIFAVDIRKPIKAVTVEGFEFRDSYILSGYSLAKTGEQLQKYKVKKLVGDLDYDLLRTPETPMDEKEISYCVNDVLVVSAYIQEQIEQYKTITRIPLTNTGRVRNFCRDACYHGFNQDKQHQKNTKSEYRKLMNCLTLTPDEYKLCQRAFMGGFTHANAVHVGQTLYNVASYDFTSSYPAVMLLDEYPMGKGFKIKIKNLDDYYRVCEKYCLIFDMKLEGLRPKDYTSDNPISLSKCWKHSRDITINNGRVVRTGKPDDGDDDGYVITSGTNIDLDIYMKFYEIHHVTIFNVYAYVKAYLPRNFLLAILKLYNDKTQLKGVEGKEKEYLHSKGMLNSAYGMCVTAIAKDESCYEGETWFPEKQDLEETIEKYNKNKSRFLFYPWGIFVTAYARRNLFSAIWACRNKGVKVTNDFCYADTDSVKILNADKHKQYFDSYNNLIQLKIKRCSIVNNIPIEMFSPKTIKGKTKTIGVWDYEGVYSMFKTLGAKRYIYVQDNKLHVTIAGVGKKSTEQYLMNHYKTFDNVFKHFENGLSIPENNTGKLTHTYIDNEVEGDVADYLGKIYHYHELSFIHLAKTGFRMSMIDSFLNYINEVKTIYEL